MANTIFRISGFSGIFLIILAILVSALLYRGTHGERYSLLNHFISELGEVGVSQGARIFNTGLFFGGLATLPYIIGLGILFHSLLGWLGTSMGIIAVLGVSAVGIFPMNNMKAHVIVATTYFRAGLMMVFFFGLAIFLQKPGRVLIPHSANILSLLAFLSYGTFLTLPIFNKADQKPDSILDPDHIPERPRIWTLAVLEWLVFFSTIFWMFGMLFFIRN